MLDFNKSIAKIGGWLTKSEGEYLYKIAKELPKDICIVEIGSWKGRSTVCLGLGARDGNGAITFAIDPHTGSSEHKKWFGKVDTYNEFLENIQQAQVSKYIKPIKKTSEAAVGDVTEKVKFVLVDGAHEYKFVNKDYELWFPKLENGGLMAFHDCWHAIGVHYLTAKILLISGKVRKPRLLDTLTIMEKVEKNNLVDRAYNLLFVVYRLLIGWIGTVKMDASGTVR